MPWLHMLTCFGYICWHVLVAYVDMPWLHMLTCFWLHMLTCFGYICWHVLVAYVDMFWLHMLACFGYIYWHVLVAYVVMFWLHMLTCSFLVTDILLCTDCWWWYKLPLQSIVRNRTLHWSISGITHYQLVSHTQLTCHFVMTSKKEYLNMLIYDVMKC